MFKCIVCGTELQDGAKACLQCKVCQEPVAKFMHGQLVKMTTKEYIYYNYVVGSYFNRDLEKHMYRLDERMSMSVYPEDWLAPVSVYPEDWLAPVSDEELTYISHTGKLTYGSMGGWKHPLFNDEEVTICC